MNKKVLRENAKRNRDLLTLQQASDFSGAIIRKLLRHPWYTACTTLFTYVSVGNEVQTHELIRSALQDGKRVCVPRVIPGDHMVAVPIQSISDDLEMGFYNIPEPRKELQPLSEQAVELVIVPGLLYDRAGYRIGYGGGYYDKYLQALSTHCRTIGLAYNEQIVDLLPHEAYDRRVMLIITESELIQLK